MKSSFFNRIAAIRILFLFFFSLAVIGCKTLESVTQIGTSLAVSQGFITESQARSINKSTSAAARTSEDITPEQEYYIGRSVGAMIIDKYKVVDDEKANHFLNVLGQTLSQASELPETFGGYHFMILDSDEINAFGAPGGLIFVTRGIIECCKHEDALAAVLAHEIGHIQGKHGIQAIKKSRVTTALTTIAIEGAKSFGKKELAELTSTFGDSISDITSTLINNGYSRSFERDADMAAVNILQAVGYDANGLVDMLFMMKENLKPGGSDFAKTHPSPDSRISDIQKRIGTYSQIKTPAARQARFEAALKKIIGNQM